VRYPSRPTLDSYAQYEKAIREMIESLGGAWNCLVDQSALTVIPPELPPRIAELNAWARTQGMGRTARVIQPIATAQLQVTRILKQSGTAQAGRLCTTRDEAWLALTQVN
jgi:hypothetical protein